MAGKLFIWSSRKTNLLLLGTFRGPFRSLGELSIRGKSTSATRSKSSVAPTVETLGVGLGKQDILEESVNDKELRKKDVLDLTFEDHGAAFKSKTTWEVMRALLVFNVCGVNMIVDNNERLMKIGQKLLGKKLFAMVMKQSFYGQFVAGEDTVRIAPTITQMQSFGVKSILDYSVEEDISQEEAEEREMESCVSDADSLNKENNSNFAGVSKDKEFTASPQEDEIRQYQPHKEFGDRRLGVTGARTFFYQGEANCERNLDTFLRCIETVATTTQTTGFAAIKVTALGRPQLLLQLSEVIARARKYHQEVTGIRGHVIEGQSDPETFEKRFKAAGIKVEGSKEVQDWLDNMTHDKKGLIHLFNWSGLIDIEILLHDLFKVPNLKTGRMEPLISALTSEEEEQFKNMLRRIHTVFQAAKDMDVRVMVDAEQTYFQPAISRLTMEMMKKYNTEKAIVFNTYQCYLKEAYKNLTLDLEQSRRQGFYFGAKLVRGAYMEQERTRAEALSYSDPINDNFEATSEMYHRCLSECMRRIHEQLVAGEEKKVGVMVASHNEDTVRFAISKMRELDIKPEDKVICFGQLLGMCDQLSFPLGQAGYSVYKYVPYGPVNEVLPYLSRRAHENKGILVKLEKEKMLLKRELKDRITQGKLFHRPKGDYTPI